MNLLAKFVLTKSKSSKHAWFIPHNYKKSKSQKSKSYFTVKANCFITSLCK